jgi:peptidoglycan hydrolase-like protein with peptidoglycan-binding domain
MQKTILMSVVWAVTAVASFAQADTEIGSFSARGTGAQICTTVTAAFQANAPIAQNEVASWLSGYISHMNRTTEDYFDVSPVQDTGHLALVVNAACTQNPDSLLEGIAWTVISALRPLASKTETNLVTVQNDLGSITLRSDVLLEMQKILVNEGVLDANQADGQYGQNTNNALRTYQEANGLSVTGLPEAFTLLSIALKLQQ